MAAAIAVHAVMAIVAFVRSPEPAADFDRYYEIASTPGRPYIDYQVEHPIGTLLVFKALALPPGGRSAFGRGVVAANVFADALIVGTLAWAWGVSAAAFYAAASAPVTGLLFTRIDLWSMAAATLAVAAWQRRRLHLAAAALAAGVSLKLWPLALAAGTLDVRVRQRTALALFVGALATLAAATLLMAGPSSIVEVLTFRGARGWQIESVVGSVIHLASVERPRLESGSWRIGSVSSWTSVLLFLAAAPLSLWTSWRGFRARRAGVAWLASISWLLLLSALLSAQYVGWLVPGAAAAWVEGNRRPAVLVALAVALTESFWTIYGGVIEGMTAAVALVVLRNVVLLVLALDATAAVGTASGFDADLQPNLPAV